LCVCVCVGVCVCVCVFVWVNLNKNFDNNNEERNNKNKPFGEDFKLPFEIISKLQINCAGARADTQHDVWYRNCINVILL